MFDKEELFELKMEVEEELGETYKIPVCPSVIAGIHFSYDGNITVDQYTGLSCHWFWLKEPEVRCIAKFLPEMSVEEITEKILDYRDGCMNNVKKFYNLISTLEALLEDVGVMCIKYFSSI